MMAGVGQSDVVTTYMSQAASKTEIIRDKFASGNGDARRFACRLCAAPCHRVDFVQARLVPFLPTMTHRCDEVSQESSWQMKACATVTISDCVRSIRQLRLASHLPW